MQKARELLGNALRKLRVIGCARYKRLACKFSAPRAMQVAPDMAKIERGWSDGRDEVVPMYEPVGALPHPVVVNAGEIGIAGARHAIGVDGPHVITVGTQSVRNKHCQCAAQTVADNEDIAPWCGRPEQRLQVSIHRVGRQLIAACGARRAKVSVEVGNPVRQHHRVGALEGGDRRAPSRRNEALRAGLRQHSRCFFDDNAVAQEGHFPKLQYVDGFLPFIGFVGELRHPYQRPGIVEIELSASRKADKGVRAVPFLRKSGEKTHESPLAGASRHAYRPHSLTFIFT